MAISNYFNRSCTLLREDFVSGSDIKKDFVQVGDQFSCHFQPLDEAIGQDGQGAFGKNWLIFCALRDIREGDKVVIDGGEYKVAGVQNYDFSGNPHLEVLLRAFKS